MDWGGPAEKPFGVLRTHIDTTVTHWRAKVIMPERAVEGVPGRGKVTCPTDAG